MKRIRIATIITITILLSLSLLLAFSATASAPNQKAFVGTWERIASKDREGQPITGATVPSHLIFSTDGHFVQATNPPGRAKLDKPVKEMTKEELLNRFENASSAYGTYALTGNTLTRKFISVTNPNLEGIDFKQTCKFEGDLLILSSTTTKSEVRFRRIK